METNELSSSSVTSPPDRSQQQEKGKMKFTSPMKQKKFTFSSKVSNKIPSQSNDQNEMIMKSETTSSSPAMLSSNHRSLSNSNSTNHSILRDSELLSSFPSISYSSPSKFDSFQQSKNISNIDLYSNYQNQYYFHFGPNYIPNTPTNITSIATSSSIPPSQGLYSINSSDKTPSRGYYWNSQVDEKAPNTSRSDSNSSHTTIPGNSTNSHSKPLPYYQSYYNPQTSQLTFHATNPPDPTKHHYSEESKQSPAPVLTFPASSRSDPPPLRLQSRPEYYIPSTPSAMIPVPYYPFPYHFDYRGMAAANEHFPKEAGAPAMNPNHAVHHPPTSAAPTIPIYPAFPPAGVISPEQTAMTSPYNMAILTPPAPVFCGTASPAEMPQFGPGPPIVTGTKLKGPRGCNLFVFHLPNEITNWDLYLLFRRYGTILSVHIMVNKATGLSKGYGFVSFAFLEDAKSAIEAMDGFRLGKKRLKVQLKRLQDDTSDDFNWEDVDVEQETNEILASTQTSGSSTAQPSPTKPLNDQKHSQTTIKVQEAAAKLGEMNLITPAQVTKTQVSKGKHGNGTRDSKP